jgi:EpsI family protein
MLKRFSRTAVAMRSNRTAFLIAALMCAASVGAVVARPNTKAADVGPAFSLETMIPKQFRNWSEEPQRISRVINPQTRELLDKLYSQILTRTYVNAEGYRIMLSLAYGSDQLGSLQAHKPEVCYPAQGFVLQKNETAVLATAFGNIPVRRLFATMGARQEPLTYWFTVGDKAVLGTTQKRLVDLRYRLTGRIPDGMLFRVSSIDRDEDRAHQMQDQFINQLLQTVSPAERKRLSGLGDS